MKIYKLSHLVVVLMVAFFGMTSCSKSTPPTTTATPSDFLNVIVAGTTYNQNMLNDFHFQSGGSNKSSCDASSYTKEQLASISPSNFSLVVSMKFYKSDSIFNKKSVIGDYAVGDEEKYPEMTCNLTLLVSYYDEVKRSFGNLVIGGKNTITSIVKGKKYATSQEYIVQGKFNCSWLLNGTTIPCTGTYQKTISVDTP